MELHTLGVDGGYTQKDVTEVARALHGLDDRGPAPGRPRFVFDAAPARRRATRSCSATASRPAAAEDGEQVIHILATHPVDRALHLHEARAPLRRRRAAAGAGRPRGRHLPRDGRRPPRGRADDRDLAGVPAPEAAPREGEDAARVRGQRACAPRAPTSDARAARPRASRELGMPLYLQQPPTGYKDTAEAWVSTSGLLARLNFALDLAAGRIPASRAGARCAAGSPTPRSRAARRPVGDDAPRPCDAESGRRPRRRRGWPGSSSARPSSRGDRADAARDGSS